MREKLASICKYTNKQQFFLANFQITVLLMPALTPACSSLTRGDYLTLYSGLQDDESITLNDISVALSATTSPQYGKKDDHFTFREMYGNVHQILDLKMTAIIYRH